jgi:hypothetical protein
MICKKAEAPTTNGQGLAKLLKQKLKEVLINSNNVFINYL